VFGRAVASRAVFKEESEGRKHGISNRNLDISSVATTQRSSSRPGAFRFGMGARDTSSQSEGTGGY